MRRKKVCKQQYAIAACFALARAQLRHAQNTVHSHALPNLLYPLQYVPRPAIPGCTELYIVNSCPLVLRRLDE
jgi:hypothetical protein